MSAENPDLKNIIGQLVMFNEKNLKDQSDKDMLIEELQKLLKEKDSQISFLERQNTFLRNEVSARIQELEEIQRLKQRNSMSISFQDFQSLNASPQSKRESILGLLLPRSEEISFEDDQHLGLDNLTTFDQVTKTTTANFVDFRRRHEDTKRHTFFQQADLNSDSDSDHSIFALAQSEKTRRYHSFSNEINADIPAIIVTTPDQISFEQDRLVENSATDIHDSPTNTEETVVATNTDADLSGNGVQDLNEVDIVFEKRTLRPRNTALTTVYAPQPQRRNAPKKTQIINEEVKPEPPVTVDSSALVLPVATPRSPSPRIRRKKVSFANDVVSPTPRRGKYLMKNDLKKGKSKRKRRPARKPKTSESTKIAAESEKPKLK